MPMVNVQVAHTPTGPKHHQIIMLNGPPACGKDTIADMIFVNYPKTRKYKMAKPLKDAVAGLFGLGIRMVSKFESRREGNTQKNEPQQLMFGMSWREGCIWMSEEVVKPRFGKEVFGVLAVKNLSRVTSTHMTTISDCGFRDELLPVIKLFGAENCHLLQVYRSGCTFANDSRSYIRETDLPEHMDFRALNNTQGLRELKQQTKAIIDDILKGAER